MPSTVKKRFQPYTGVASAHIKCTGTFGAVEFMRRKAGHVHPLRVDIYLYLSCGLCRIGKKKNIPFVAYAADGGNVLYQAGLVIRHHDGSEYGVWRYGGNEFIRIKKSLAVYTEYRQPKAGCLKTLASVQYCGVFRGTCDDMPTFVDIHMCSTFYGEIDAFSGT